MTFRSDVTVDWTQSPRLIFVAAPSTEITIQDLYDTLRRLEEQFWEGLPYPSIIDIAGKEDLGGGVLVGLTAKLLDARLAFEARKISDGYGTITTTDTSGRTLTDSNATFISNGIVPGAFVINFTDRSKATVLRVLSETQLLTDFLGDGSDNQFQIGDFYKVQNVIQCEVNGGNIVAIDSDGYTIPALLPTFGTQIIRTSSSSATLQELLDIQFSSFGGGVTVDFTSSFSGTTFPVGTPRQPVNNFADAIAIVQNVGLPLVFYIIGDVVVNSGLNYNGFAFKGESPNQSKLDINSSAQVLGCEFFNIHVHGTLDGYNFIKDCKIHGLNYINGIVVNSIIESTIMLGGNTKFINCSSGSISEGESIIDFNNSASELILENFNGAITIRNKTSSEPMIIDLNSGRLTIENTVTSGTITVRGVGTLINNGTATVDSSNLLNPATITDAVWDEQMSQHNTSGSMGEALASAGLTPEQAKQLLIVFINSL